MSEPVVIVTNAERSFGHGSGAVRALRGASLTIDRGEFVALVGPSGSGKTTLLNCLVGLDSLDVGRVEVLGVDVGELGYEAAVEWRRQTTALVFQTIGLLPYLTAMENVDAMLRLRGVGRAERARRSADVLDRLGLGGFGDHRPAELSGGQRQRVSLARALAVQPELLIADEPTGQLDSETTLQVLAELHAACAQNGTTTLVATHDAEVIAVADRALHLRDGVIERPHPPATGSEP